MEADRRTQDSMRESARGERGEREGGRRVTDSPTRGDGGNESPDSNSALSSSSSSSSRSESVTEYVQQYLIKSSSCDELRQSCSYRRVNQGTVKLRKQLMVVKIVIDAGHLRLVLVVTSVPSYNPDDKDD